MGSLRPAIALAAVASLLAAGCGDDDEGPSTEPAATSATAATPTGTRASRDSAAESGPSHEKGPVRSGVTGGRESEPASGNDPPSAPTASAQPSDAARERAASDAESAYREYVAAINGADGEALCDLLPPRTVAVLRPPATGTSCAARIGGSIGYRDPRGYPVWKRTILGGIDSAAVGRDLAGVRLTASIATEFADRSEPSIESDIAYLEQVAGSWRLAKPTGALYRAIGRPEPPPTAITPP